MANEKHDKGTSQQVLILLASVLITVSLGSVHGYSIFLEQLERQLEISRFASSLVYSVALASITLAVFAGHLFYRSFSPGFVAVLSLLLTVAGYLLATQVSGYWSFLLGYGLVFGFANGLGYGLTIYLCGRHFVENKGLAIGLVTAVYPLGAMITSFAAAPWLESLKVQQILVYQGLAIATCLLFAAAILLAVRLKKQQAINDGTPVQAFTPLQTRLVVRLFFTYGFGVFAGLMIMGHASAMMSATGGSFQFIALAIVAVSAGNIIGGFLGGGMSDNLAPRNAFWAVLGMSVASLAVLLFFRSPVGVFVGMTILGLAYGAYIVVVPTAVSNYFGPELSAKAYGLVFLAWGSAGILAPGFAGWLYEFVGYFPEAILLALFFTFGAIVLAKDLPDLDRS